MRQFDIQGQQSAHVFAAEAQQLYASSLRLGHHARQPGKIVEQARRNMITKHCQATDLERAVQKQHEVLLPLGVLTWNE